MKTPVAIVACVLSVCMCANGGGAGQSPQVNIEFDNGSGSYGLSTVRWFEPFMKMFENLGLDDLDEERYNVFMAKEDFEEVITLCSDVPQETADIGEIKLHRMLESSNYLNIQDPQASRRFYSNLAKRSLLGSLSKSITDDREIEAPTPGRRARIMKRLADYRGFMRRGLLSTCARGTPNATESNCEGIDCRHFVEPGIYLRLLDGYMHAIGKRIGFASGVATAYEPTDPRAKNYGSLLDPVNFRRAVTKLRLVQHADVKMWHENTVGSVGWFLRNIGVLSLDLSGFHLTGDHMQELSLLVLTDLEIAMCDLPPGSLVLLLPSDSPLRETLDNLDVSYNRMLGREDRAVIASLGLRHLGVQGCFAAAGGVASVLGSRLRENLQGLKLRLARLNTEDMAAIAGLRKLEDLQMGKCRIPLGGFKLLTAQDRVLRKTLRRLDVSHTPLQPEDIEAILQAGKLRELHMQGCDLAKGCLVAFLRDEGTELREGLRRLSLAGNRKLGLDDMIAVACMVQLDDLDISLCLLPTGSIAALLDEEGELRRSLSRLNVSYNHLSEEDNRGIDGLRSCEVEYRRPSL